MKYQSIYKCNRCGAEFILPNKYNEVRYVELRDSTSYVEHNCGGNHYGLGQIVGVDEIEDLDKTLKDNL